jgi:succinate dehydrogenase / fumarate reductase cytochrome b subunit
MIGYSSDFYPLRSGPVTSTASPAAAISVKSGVAPLRAGAGYSFLLRRLHSLSGIVPVGLFLIEHFISNAFATKGPQAYTKQVELLTSFPFVVGLELFGIWLPILYHSLYGFYIWYRGDSNLGSYPWIGNWMYAAQRWTGAIAFLYMLYHTWHLRFTGVHLLTHPAASFGKVQMEFHNIWIANFYLLGIVAASWHFGYGLWLFAAKWGITSGDKARRRFGYVCAMIAVAFIVVGILTMRSFYQWPQQPLDTSLTGDSYVML